jgi:hypothetical protein
VKDAESFVVVFESEEALADYERCNEILYGPEVSAEGYARAGTEQPRRPRTDFTRWFRRARRG